MDFDFRAKGLRMRGSGVYLRQAVILKSTDFDRDLVLGGLMGKILYLFSDWSFLFGKKVKIHIWLG